MERVSVLCVLLLLCSLSGAELQDNEISEQRQVGPESVNVPEQPQPCPSDLHAVLRDMSAALAEHRVRIQQLQTLNQEQAAKLRELELKNNDVDALKQQQQAHAAKLREVDMLMQKQQAQADELMSIKTQTNVTEHYVESLRRDREVGQVAFSAGLSASESGNLGPFNTHTHLVFRHVISNIGNAYNPNTGFFIAPVKGAYHFEFYIGSYSSAHHQTAAALVKNGEHVIITHERGVNGHSSAANGATLLLEHGDVVFLRLWQNNMIYDDHLHYSSFSGHLLFPM